MPEIKAADNPFIQHTDVFANHINARANELYSQLLHLDVTQLNTADKYKDYFIKHHLGRRLYFSLQNSAHIIYEAVKQTGKQAHELTFTDYGAGLGTLFMLAGKMGFKKTIYNDYFPEWHQPAKIICNALTIKMDDFIEGDIESVTAYADANNIKLDIIASRNVIEHIYDLPAFYNCIFKHHNKAVIFSTTTANFHNPVMRCYHIYIHKKWERLAYRKQRIIEIKKISPSISNSQLVTISELTRGKGQHDFTNAVHALMKGNPIEKDKTLRSNTCDCITGVWNEHLLTKKEYYNIITSAGFQFQFTPGYWDTHYKFSSMNFVAKIFNTIILRLGKRGILLSPFVNVIAYN